MGVAQTAKNLQLGGWTQTLKSWQPSSVITQRDATQTQQLRIPSTSFFCPPLYPVIGVVQCILGCVSNEVTLEGTACA